MLTTTRRICAQCWKSRYAVRVLHAPLLCTHSRAKFGVLEQLQVQAGEKDGRIHELETENDVLLERLAELTIQLEQK
jgi:hypothetical protein